MNKETEQKEDGRYIIFYTFEDEKEEDTPAERTYRTPNSESP